MGALTQLKAIYRKRRMRVLRKKPSAKAPPERFTGDMWVDTITETQAPSRLRAATVRFAPCARTAWHRHREALRRCSARALSASRLRAGL